MASKAVRADSKGGNAPVRPVLEVLLLYEDLGTALRAKRSLDRLPGQRGAQTGLHTRLWRLDLLRQPLLAEQAAIEAAAADVIILSLRRRKHLQAEVRNWLNRWLDHREDRPYALAVLLSGEPARAGSRSPVVAYLQRVAETAHANLFCESCGGIDLGLNLAVGEISDSRSRHLRAAGRT